MLMMNAVSIMTHGKCKLWRESLQLGERTIPVDRPVQQT